MQKRSNSAEELEFLNEDSMNDNSSMNNHNGFNMNNVDSSGAATSEIGVWFLKQSKVLSVSMSIINCKLVLLCSHLLYDP